MPFLPTSGWMLAARDMDVAHRVPPNAATQPFMYGFAYETVCGRLALPAVWHMVEQRPFCTHCAEPEPARVRITDRRGIAA